MTDFLGRTLNVGDKVVYLMHYSTSSYYYKTVVTGFTQKKVRVAIETNHNKTMCVESYKLIKYEE